MIQYLSWQLPMLKRQRGVTAEHLSKVWRISDEVAQRTLKVTTQLNKQDVNPSLSRRFGTNDRMLRYKRILSLFYIDMVYLAPGAAQRDPYDEEYADIEDKFLDFKGDLIHHPHSSATVLYQVSTVMAMALTYVFA